MKVRVAIVMIVLAGGLACEPGDARSPEERAQAILERHGDDESRAGSIWRERSGNWDLGLDDQVAWIDPLSPLSVRTTRDLLTPGLRRCVQSDSFVDYRTALTEGDGRRLAVFRWPSLDAARAGHRRVRRAVAAARGDLGALWQGVDGDPELAGACLLFRERRDLCHSGEVGRPTS